MKISGQQRDVLDYVIRIVIEAKSLLMDQFPSQAMQQVPMFGKNDTLSLDALPELICNDRLQNYNDRIPLITEENGKTYTEDELNYEMVMIADPTDRSSQLATFFEVLSKRDDAKRLDDQHKEPEWLDEWTAIGSTPVQVTGATIAITCVHHGLPLFSVILNYITGTLFMACPTGVYSIDVDSMEENDMAALTSLIVSEKGTPIQFPSIRQRQLRGDAVLQFTAFTKKSGYPENLQEGMVTIRDPLSRVAYDAPGGPSRLLYLSSVNSGEGALPVGFIVANGEKITEWIHWLPFVRFAINQNGGAALRLFEVSAKNPKSKDGIMMSTLPDYSIFQQDDDTRTFRLNIATLSRHKNPSQYRSMFVVTPHDNDRVVNLMLQSGYREIVFP